MNTVNTELLDLVVKTIETEPTKWHQGSYRTIRQGEVSSYKDHKDPRTGTIRRHRTFEVNCETAFCVAGWAVQLGSEDTPIWTDSSTLLANEFDNPDECALGTTYVSARAKRLLGLDEYQAYTLFAGENSLKTIKGIVKQIKAGKKVVCACGESHG